MSVRFLLGASGSGKSRQIYNEIIQASIKEPERNFYLIVPEQYTMEAQRELVTMHPAGGMMNIDAIGMNRLAYRVFDELGISTGQVLEDFGKSMLIKKILCEQQDTLQVYGSYYDKLGFVDEMKSMMSEIFQYNIKQDTIDEIMEQIPEDSVVAGKMQDIRHIYEEFEAFAGERYIVAEQLVELLTRHVGQSKLVCGSSLYFDGFTGFTPVQLELVEKLMTCADDLTFSFTLDDRDQKYEHIKDYELFYLTKTTIKKLTEAAAAAGVEIESPVVLPGTINYRLGENRELFFLERNLFRSPYQKWKQPLERIHLTATGDAQDEIVFVASTIRRLVREKGYRYKDIAIVAGDLEQASHIYERVMDEYEIPVFIDANACLKANPCAETIRSVLAVLADDFSYDSVFRFLKAGMTDLSFEDIELLENYALKRGVRGYSRWNRAVSENYEKTSPVNVEEIRQAFMKMFGDIRKVFADKKAATKDYVEALYDFLLQIHMYEKLEARENELYEENRINEGDAYGQIFEKTVRLFDKIAELLGDTKMSVKEFYEIVDTGLSDIEVGVVPPTVDRVLIGDITRSRLNHIKVLFFTSVNDGIVPKAPKKGRILSDRDRDILSDCGLELAPSDKQNSYIEQFYIYTILTKPSDHLYISYHKLSASLESMRPSYLLGRISSIFPSLQAEEYDAASCMPDTVNRSLRRVLRTEEDDSEDAESRILTRILTEKGFTRELTAIYKGRTYRNVAEQLPPETIALLYGRYLHASVSKLELYARCGFAYFLKYGLRLKEREMYQVDVRNVGVILHSVMEGLFKQVRDTRNNDWENFPEDERMLMVTELVNRAAEESAGDFFEDNARNAYMLQMIERMAQTSAGMLQKHIRLGSMKPGMLEKTFDSAKDEVGSYLFELPNQIQMSINGKIDRVDVEEEDGTVYIKVIDYKSSARKLSLEEILNGEQLQLVTYSAIAYEIEKMIYPDKNIQIAGLLYYSFDDPVIEIESSEIDTDTEQPEFSDQEKLDAERMEKMKLQGFVNESPAVIQKMDHTCNQSLPVKLDKNGDIKKSENVVSADQIRTIMELTRENIEELGSQIAEGKIAIEPYKNKSNTGCDYCEFKNICHFDVKNGGNQYRRPDNEKLKRYREE
ncbi:MAG: PD-(D/E)XK nuclease family protein [Coprococcus sp.]